MMQTESIKVWDPLVRIFHWSLVLFFAVAYISGESDLDTVHAWAGYIIAGLITFRLIWGIIGTKHARFSGFVYRPAVIKQYLKSLLSRHPKHYIGHNPAGGAMVIIMLLMLIVLSWTGLLTYAAEGKGPLADGSPITISSAYADDDWGDWKNWGDSDRKHKGDDFWEDIHELTANLMLLLIALHLGGVLISSLLHGENLPRAMITGRKKLRSEDEQH